MYTSDLEEAFTSEEVTRSDRPGSLDQRQGREAGHEE